jgi:hypothetical protein
MTNNSQSRAPIMMNTPGKFKIEFDLQLYSRGVVSAWTFLALQIQDLESAIGQDQSLVDYFDGKQKGWKWLSCFLNAVPMYFQSPVRAVSLQVEFAKSRLNESKLMLQELNDLLENLIESNPRLKEYDYELSFRQDSFDEMQQMLAFNAASETFSRLYGIHEPSGRLLLAQMMAGNSEPLLQFRAIMDSVVPVAQKALGVVDPNEPNKLIN